MSNYGFTGDVPDGVSIQNNIDRALEYQSNHSFAETVLKSITIFIFFKLFKRSLDFIRRVICGIKGNNINK